MKCSIFIAPSADGYISTKDGGVHWLETASKPISEKEAAFPNNFVELKYKVKYL